MKYLHLFGWMTLSILPCVAAVVPTTSSDAFLKDIPVFCQEFHVWYGFPYPDTSREFAHETSLMVSQGEPWKLNWQLNGYPMVGPYESANPEIIRWQIRCAKASGLTSVALHLFPEWTHGLTYLREKDIVPVALKIAAQEKYPIFFEDEVAFRKGSPAMDPGVMAQRVAAFLKKYASDPGYFKMDGKPVFYYQSYGNFLGKEPTETMFDQVEKALGRPVYWMLFGDPDMGGQVRQVQALVSGGNIPREDQSTRKWNYSIQDPLSLVTEGHKDGKKMGTIFYLKFDVTYKVGMFRGNNVVIYGENGETGKACIKEALKAKPDFLMLSSWNDWEESTNLEPGWDFDGFTGDPYAYVRLIAKWKGITFTPPPFPPKEAVHPSIWEKLGYGDGAGPVIDQVRRTHTRGGSLEVQAHDSMNPVTAIAVVWNGDLFWTAPQPESTLTTSLQPLTSGLSVHPLKSLFGMLAGNVLAPLNAELGFRGDFHSVGNQPFIGIAYAYDRSDPFSAPMLDIQREKPTVLDEPVGKVVDKVHIDFSPSARSEDFENSVWEGFQTRVALAYAPIDPSSTTVTLTPNKTQLAHLSFLGPVKQADISPAKPEKRDRSGMFATFHIPLTPDQLDHPGAHFVWLRAKDSVGNWGSPKLVAVSNFEKSPDTTLAKTTIAAPYAGDPTVVMADDFSQPNGSWSPDLTVDHEDAMVSKAFAAPSNTNSAISGIPFAQPIEGPFSLKFRMRSTEWQRRGILWLTDSSSTKGYGISFDSSVQTNAQGQGLVSLLKLDAPQPVNWSSDGDPLIRAVPSGHFVTDGSFFEVELKREVAGGPLTLWLDGKQMAEANDTAVSAFDRVYLRGMEGMQFGDLVVRKLEQKKANDETAK